VNDDDLADRLREEFPPVPEHLLRLGHEAFRWYEPDATLASLGAEADGAPPGVRGGGARRLTFSAPRVGVEIEVCGREIVGRLSPPSAADVVLRSPAGECNARTDESGGFALFGVPAGPVSLLFRFGDATSVVTSWIRV
jgi:hypothetical protein